MDKRNQTRKISRNTVKFGEKSCDKMAITSNLAPDGFFLRTNRVSPPGKLLHFEFRSPDGKVVNVSGRVVHANRVPPQLSRVCRSGMGIRIEGDRNDYLQLLEMLRVQVKQED
jgi:hypothetical protein